MAAKKYGLAPDAHHGHFVRVLGLAADYKQQRHEDSGREVMPSQHTPDHELTAASVSLASVSDSAADPIRRLNTPDGLKVASGRVETRRISSSTSTRESWRSRMTSLPRRAVIDCTRSDSANRLRSAAAASVRTLAGGGPNRSSRRTIPYKDGGARYVHVNYVPDFINQGDVKGFFVLVTDLTERKLAEEELQKHRDRLEELVAERFPGDDDRALRALCLLRL